MVRSINEARKEGIVLEALSKQSQKVMKTALHGLKLLVIDEISMVSTLNFT